VSRIGDGRDARSAPAPRPPRAVSPLHALLRWQRTAGPYWPYVCAAPFLGPLPPPAHRPPRPRPSPALLDLLTHLTGPATALFVDLPAPAALGAAPSLSRLGVAVVPVLQRWCAPRSLLPSRPLLDALIAAAPVTAPPRHGSRVVFFLDGERAGPPGLQPPAHRFDNRYDYPACRFPPPELLRREGVARVLWLSRRGIAPDLRGYAHRLAAAGLPPAVVDAATLAAGPPPA
jgi:hypothetical protein